MNSSRLKPAIFLVLLFSIGGGLYLANDLIYKRGGAVVVESPDHAFHFTLPAGAAAPAVSGNDLSDDPGNVQTIDITSQDDHGSFVVRRMRIPDEVWANETNKQMLDEARDNLLRIPTTALDREDPFQFQGNAGCSLRLHDTTVAKEQFSRMDFILAKPSIYILSFMSLRKDAVDGAGVQQFFSSLVLDAKSAN